MTTTTKLHNVGVYLPEREKLILDKYSQKKGLTSSSAVILLLWERAIAESINPELFKQVERIIESDDQIKRLSKRRSKGNVGKQKK